MKPNMPAPFRKMVDMAESVEGKYKRASETASAAIQLGRRAVSAGTAAMRPYVDAFVSGTQQLFGAEESGQ
jgi:hypothetical protein